MRLEHEFVVSASFEETWRFLLDPERVSPCLPGVLLDSVGGNVFAGRWKVKIGPVTVTYRGTARLVRIDPESGTLVLEASGKESRGDGTAQATANISVSSAGPGSRVRLVSELNLTGRAGEFERKVVARAEERIFERFALAATEDIGRRQAGPAAGPAAAPPYPGSGAPDGGRDQAARTPPDLPAYDVPAGAPAGTPADPVADTGAGTPAGGPPVRPPARTTPRPAVAPGDELDLFGPAPARPPVLAWAFAVVLAGLGFGWRRRRRLRRSDG